MSRLQDKFNELHSAHKKGLVIYLTAGIPDANGTLETVKTAVDNGADVTVDTLIEKGIVKNPRDGVKILGGGELTKKLNVTVNAYSASAKEKIEALGGKAEVM